MNLKEILSYRKNCLIHNLPMNPYISTKVKVKILSDGIELLVHSKGDEIDKPSLRALAFNNDGTYLITYNCPKALTKDNIVIYMMCSNCFDTPIFISRPLGATTLSEIRTKQHFYSFMLTGGDVQFTYTCKLVSETIKYHLLGKFYHIDADLESQKANCKMGQCELSDTLNDILKNLLSVDVPQMNMDKIVTIEQLMKKIKLYNILS